MPPYPAPDDEPLQVGEPVQFFQNSEAAPSAAFITRVHDNGEIVDLVAWGPKPSAFAGMQRVPSNWVEHHDVTMRTPSLASHPFFVRLGEVSADIRES